SCRKDSSHCCGSCSSLRARNFLVEPSGGSGKAMRKRKEISKPRPAAEPAEGAELGAGRRSARLRLRAAWMYYVEEMTQNAIADRLGGGRVTVGRLLNDGRALHEVRVSVSRDIAELLRLEFALEQAFGIKEAVVAPLSGKDADPSLPIGAATG